MLQTIVETVVMILPVGVTVGATMMFFADIVPDAILPKRWRFVW
jgi:hypothetical protein